MEKKLLEYDFPADLKDMSEREFELLSYEIRDFLLDRVSKTGGHIASNLGAVELTIALHRVFNSPTDKIIWDVGHQSYIHKILTGRGDQFDGLRSLGGLSGFPKRHESEHDMYDAGHASTSISIGMGYATARDLDGQNYDVISVLGDGALTGGMAFEALNNAGTAGAKLIVILNDNEMSIDKNSGSLSQHLGKLRASHAYLDFKKQLKKTVKSIPRVGEGLLTGMEHLRDSVKYALVQGAIFEELGFKYFGPIDGHNLHDLIEIFSVAKMAEGPILIHVVTKKGKGYRNAESNPSKYHGISSFDLQTGQVNGSKDTATYSQVFGNHLVEMASQNDKIIAISAAMIEATGLGTFQKQFPNRTFDVGIAEQHAVSFAAGLALNGYRPVVAIYSTFLQRGYDQLITDVCLQNLPVLFMIDRAGIVGNDGETHHGVFDFSYLAPLPSLTVLSPKDGQELKSMMDYAMTLEGPCAIRYARGIAGNSSGEQDVLPIERGSELLIKGDTVSLLAIGKMVDIALKAAKRLKEIGIDAEVINARFLRPLDMTAILTSVKKTKHIVTIEDNALVGGFGSSILSLLSINQQWKVQSLCLGWPDHFIQHGDTEELFKLYGLDADSVAERVRDFIEGKA